MTFLPIVERELRVAARRRMTHWSRAIVALMAIGLGVFVYLLSLGEAPRDLGSHLFVALAYVAFFFCLLAGVFLTSDCLSEEKREGTLGLLFLTDLKGYDIVLGKLAATSFGGLYGLLAVLPVLAITLLLGGVTQGEFWRMALVLSNFFLLSLAVGIFVSAVSRDTIKCMLGTISLLMLLNAGMPGFAFWLSDHSHPVGDTLLDLTPPAAFFFAFAGGYQSHSSDFWWSLGVTHGFTWAFIVLACLVVPQSWQDQVDAPAAGWRSLWRKWSFGDDAQRTAYRKRLLDVNPFYWLAGRERRIPAYVWGFLGLLTVLWLCAWREWRQDWLNPACYMLTACVLNFTLKASLALEAGRQLGESRKMGALELLLSTPLSERDILRGQFLALRRQFLGPALTVLAIEIILLFASMRDSSFDAAGVGFLLAGMALLVADMIVLSWVGMWVALKAKNPNLIAIGALMRIVIIPNTAFIIFSIVIGVLTRGSGPDASFMVMLWFGLRMMNDIYAAANACWRLQRDFRLMAVERFAPAQSRFRRWFARTD